MIESMIREWSGETVILRHDPPTAAWIFIAIHSTRLGPAVGGTRMKAYPDVLSALNDAMRLAEGMTYKFATPGLPYGGGKAVIAVPSSLDAQLRPALLRRYGALVHQLGGLFFTGPDLGTSTPDMDIIAETGAPYIFARSVTSGGSGDPGPFTARGVLAGIEVVCEHLFQDPSLQGRRVLVQGAGDVGANLIQYLGDSGAEVLFTEIDEGLIRRFRDQLGLQYVPPGAVYATECDIFAPCALGGVLNMSTIPLLKCRAVAGSANNQLGTPDDAEGLHARKILSAPDYVVNAGGAMAIILMETQGWTRERAEQEVVESIQRALRQIFASAEAEGIAPEAAARRIADHRLSRQT